MGYRYLRVGLFWAGRYAFKRLMLGVSNFIYCGFGYRPIMDLRICFMRMVGVKLGRGCSFGDSFYVLNGKNVKMGSECVFGSFCKIYDWSPILLGDRVFISNGLSIVSATHELANFDPVPGPVTIGNNVWIGINVTIVGPVNIGSNCVIGAGSLVLKDVPDNSIVGGVPARLIRER